MTQDNYQLDTEAAASELASAGKSGTAGDKRQFKPKPFKDGQSYVNKLFVGLVQPKALPGFENYPLDHKLFYIKLFGHYVAVSADGKKQEFVLCKRSHNKYVAGLAKNAKAVMFEDDRCASCEEADGIWDNWKARWAELGYPDQESKKALSKEQYKAVSNDPQIVALKEAALVYTVKDRYAFPMYDMEQQPLQKGFQWYFGPETVFKGLMDLVTAGVRFYSLAPSTTTEGAVLGSEILLNKDTTNGARFCEYSVRDNRAPLMFAPEELEYLRDQRNLPSLMEMVSVWDYDTHKEFIMAGVTDGGGAPSAGPTTRPTAPAPVVARPVAPAAARAPAPAPARPAPAAPARAVAPAPAARPVAPPTPEAVAPAGLTTPAAPVAAAPQPAAAVAPGAPKPRRTW